MRTSGQTGFGLELRSRGKVDHSPTLWLQTEATPSRDAIGCRLVVIPKRGIWDGGSGGVRKTLSKGHIAVSTNNFLRNISMFPECIFAEKISDDKNGCRCSKRGASVSFGICARSCSESNGPWKTELLNEINKSLQENRSTPPEPSWVEMGANLTASLAVWASAGFPVAQEATIEGRRSSCLACDFWDSTARRGLGRCRECGCCSVKWWLQTSKCKLGRWPC